VIESITGETASLGTDQVRGIEIAVADRGGELMGHPIELQVEDDGCDAAVGTTAAQKVVADESIVGVIGTSCSGAAVPAMEILSPAGFTMISGSNTSPILTQAAGEEGIAHQEGYFRTAHNDQIQGAAAASFAFDELNVTKAATVHDGDPYTQGLADAFAKSFTEFGGEVTLATSVNKGDTDMRPVLTEIAASGAEIVFFPIFQPEADFIVKQAGEVEGLGDILMGADGLLSDTFVEDIPETEGMYFSGPATPDNLRYRDFVGKYEVEFGEKPIQAFHAHAYDAMNILLDAIEAVGAEDGGSLTIGRGALRDEIAGTSGYEGLTGNLTCDEFGDCADPVIQVVQNTEAEQTITDVKANILFTYTP
jgi:branched-chain amino acid transport system substrate-binding protein